MLETIFYIALFGILHSYLFYPLLMRFIGLFSQKSKRSSDLTSHPSVEIIFAAYNEEEVIREKILSSLKTSYPKEKLSLKIGSDASTDNTDRIIRELQETHPKIHLERFAGRTGKAAIINELVAQSKAELVILTDANIIFEEDTIPLLVKALEDPRVGIAGGKIIYRNIAGKGISKQENLYLRWENTLKRLESDIFGKAMGVEGGCYIIRRELFPGIPPRFYMEDFYVSLNLMQREYKVIFEDRAVCHEDVSTQSTEEYKRKVRISIGNFQNLGTFWKIIFRRFFPTGFIFLSHKVLRWLTPFFLLILLLTCTLLASSSPYFALFAGIYMMMIGLGLFGILFSQRKGAGILKYPGHFIHMNLALLEGFVIFTKGVNTNVWQPTRRNQK